MPVMWEDKAWDDYQYWLQQDKKTLKKINKLIEDIQRNGYTGIGKPEALKDNLSGMWSRRIDDNGNRVVYFIEDDVPHIVSCRGHYDDVPKQNKS